MPFVQLQPDPNIKGRGTGILQDHPCKIRVSTQRLYGSLIVELFDGAHKVGEGLLHAKNERWEGTCTEFGGNWLVSGPVGSGRLEFGE